MDHSFVDMITSSTVCMMVIPRVRLPVARTRADIRHWPVSK